LSTYDHGSAVMRITGENSDDAERR